MCHAEKVAGKTGRRVFSYPISYFGMMPDSKDIDIMYGIRAACVSGPASTNDVLGVWHGNPFEETLHRA